MTDPRLAEFRWRVSAFPRWQMPIRRALSMGSRGPVVFTDGPASPARLVALLGRKP